MINVVTNYFKNEINALQRSKDVDVMSTHHYHIIYVSQDKVVKNLVRGYARIFAEQNKKYGVDSKMSGEWLGLHIKDVEQAATVAYNNFYAVEEKLRKYYPKAGAYFRFFTTSGMDFKLVIPPGAFRDRKDKSSPEGRGNVPYINQMFAAAFADACVSMGTSLAGKSLATSFTTKDARIHNRQAGRRITHGVVGNSNKDNNLKTTATHGLARRFAGLDEAGEFTEPPVDVRIKRDSSVKHMAKKVGNNTAVQVIDMFKDAINTEFKLTDIKNTTLNELNRDIEVELEYADAAHNKLMDGRDAPGLKRYVANYEKKLLKKRNLNMLARRFAVSAVDMQGSKSIKEKAIAVTPHLIIKNMFPHKSKPDMRLAVNKKLVREAVQELKREKNKKKTKVTKTKRKGTKKLANAAVVGRAIKKGRTRGKVDQKAGSNPMALKALLNEMLPQTVSQNMVSPALQYRTGRFANSVRVDNITQGPRGGNTMIEASYMSNPYETFAPGGKMYTSQRDPEKLIKRSIRQVATSLVGARFGIEIQ